MMEKKMKIRYTKAELEEALTMVENGFSHKQACEGKALNKSIIAREMRKRGNEKAQKNIDESNKENFDAFLKNYDDLKK